MTMCLRSHVPAYPTLAGVVVFARNTAEPTGGVTMNALMPHRRPRPLYSLSLSLSLEEHVPSYAVLSQASSDPAAVVVSAFTDSIHHDCAVLRFFS